MIPLRFVGGRTLGKEEGIGTGNKKHYRARYVESALDDALDQSQDRDNLRYVSCYVH
jgi:hypothetical protein